jgi:hypothetical protein
LEDVYVLTLIYVLFFVFDFLDRLIFLNWARKDYLVFRGAPFVALFEWRCVKIRRGRGGRLCKYYFIIVVRASNRVIKIVLVEEIIS